MADNVIPFPAKKKEAEFALIYAILQGEEYIIQASGKQEDVLFLFKKIIECVRSQEDKDE